MASTSHKLRRALDPVFETDGTVTTIFPGDTMVPIAAVDQASGDIVVLSEFDFINASGTQIGLTGYTAAGELATTFGTNGSTITNFSSFPFDPFGFALEPNGEILVAGTVSTAGITDFGLAQFRASGVLDTSLGPDGVVAVRVGTSLDAPSAFLRSPTDNF